MPPPDQHGRDPVSDWSEVDRWLRVLRQRRWTIYLFGERTAPKVVCAVLEWRHERCADVLVLRGHDRAMAYRTPLHENADLFAPQWVHWWWARADHPRAAVWALRSILTLRPPTQGDQRPILDAPTFCGLSPDERRLRPVAIRPLSPYAR